MKKERLGLFGSLTLGASVALAACGVDNTPATQRPTTQPTENPTPTVIFTPTPEITASPTPVITPTPEITPAPTPEATAIPIADLVTQVVDKATQSGWTKVSAQKVIDSITNAYNNDPEAAAIVNPATNSLEKDLNIDPTDPCYTSKDTVVKRVACAGLLGAIYWKGYKIDENELWLKSISDVIYYAHSTLGSQDFNAFKNAASDQKNPF